MAFWHDPSFQAFLDSNPQLEALGSFLPSSLGTESFVGQREIEQLRSSYKKHGYHHLLYALVRALKPRQCVEIGVLQGFSLLSIASALRDNGDGAGMVEGFDLFEDYPYRHENYATVSARIKALGMQDWAKVHRADAFEVHRRYDEVDFLHVDISNTGDTYRIFFEQWSGKVKKAMIFEGGSAERDRVDWMVKYEKPSILEALDQIRDAYPEWRIMVLDPFPSITVAIPTGRWHIGDSRC